MVGDSLRSINEQAGLRCLLHDASVSWDRDASSGIDLILPEISKKKSSTGCKYAILYLTSVSTQVCDICTLLICCMSEILMGKRIDSCGLVANVSRLETVPRQR